MTCFLPAIATRRRRDMDEDNMGEHNAMAIAKRDFAKLNNDVDAEGWVAQYFFDAGQRYRIYGDPRIPYEQPKGKAPEEPCFRSAAHVEHAWWPLNCEKDPDAAKRQCSGGK